MSEEKLATSEAGEPSLKRKRPLGLVLLLLTSVSAGFVGGWLGSSSHFQNKLLGNQSTEIKQQVILNESQLISEIAKSVGPSVVSVNVTSQSPSDMFNFGQPISQESAGTGVIISSEGVVVTNRHVVPRGTTSVSLTLSDGTQLDSVEVIGRTNDNDPLDIAFLKIKDKKGKDLKPARLGDSAKVQVGDKVIAIGNALGQFQNTVTSGIISGYGRTVEAGDTEGTETLQNLFQTDAAINQGNSGGPLVNIKGEIIAINTAIAGNAEGIGFAIPVNDIAGLVKSVLEKGKLERPYLGVRYIALTDDYAYELNLSVKRGAYIVPAGRSGQPAIIADSPAAKAGLKEKDVITKINDTAIDENNSLVSVLGRHNVGESVKLTIIRADKEMKVDVKLEAAPAD